MSMVIWVAGFWAGQLSFMFCSKVIFLRLSILLAYLFFGYWLISTFRVCIWWRFFKTENRWCIKAALFVVGFFWGAKYGGGTPAFNLYGAKIVEVPIVETGQNSRLVVEYQGYRYQAKGVGQKGDLGNVYCSFSVGDPLMNDCRFVSSSLRRANSEQRKNADIANYFGIKKYLEAKLTLFSLFWRGWFEGLLFGKKKIYRKN